MNGAAARLHPKQVGPGGRTGAGTATLHPLHRARKQRSRSPRVRSGDGRALSGDDATGLHHRCPRPHRCLPGKSQSTGASNAANRLPRRPAGHQRDPQHQGQGSLAAIAEPLSRAPVTVPAMRPRSGPTNSTVVGAWRPKGAVLHAPAAHGGVASCSPTGTPGPWSSTAGTAHAGSPTSPLPNPHQARAQAQIC